MKVEDFVAGASTAAFTSTYRYDGLGRRIEKVANGQTKRYVYDEEDILLEYDGANVLQARYTHGPGIDEPIAVTKGSNTYFYHQDGLGSVTDLTDSAGATAKSYAYDAYGNILESSGTLEQPYSYTGRELDSESGLYYYRARHYDPTARRFLQEDPMGIVGGDINLHRYVQNNPVNLVDPFGLIDKPPSRNIKPSPGDPLGDQLRKIDSEKNLSAKDRKDKLEKIEKEIKKLPPGEHKRILKGFLKVVKRFGTVCLIFELLEEVIGPDIEQDSNAS